MGNRSTKLTEEERRDEALQEKFGSKLLFSVKVVRPQEKYPYEIAIWDSEISIPVTDSKKHVDKVVTAWIKTMEAGIELAGAFRDDKTTS